MLEFDLFEIHIIKIYMYLCVCCACAYVDQTVANSLMVCFPAAATAARQSLIIKKTYILVKNACVFKQ